MAATILTWLISSVGMVEGIVFFLMSDSMAAGVEAVVFTTIALLLAIPGIVLLPMVEECERELARRGALPANYISLSRRLPRYVLRMMIFGLLVPLVVAGRSHIH